MSILDANGAIHDSSNGQFAGHLLGESDAQQVLPGSQTHPGIDRLVELGYLSPAARDMPPREVIDQWCEANVATLRERADMLGAVGLLPIMRADELVVGDQIELLPVVNAYSDEDDEIAVFAAEAEYALVQEPTDIEWSAASGYDGRIAVLHTDQGDWGVEDNEPVEVRPDFGGARCGNCGVAVPSPDHPQDADGCPPPATERLRRSR